MIAPLIRLVVASATTRLLRSAASDMALRLMLALGALLAGTVGVLCFSYAGFIVLERHIDSAAAWAILGGLYAIAGLSLYLTATRRRRGVRLLTD